MANRTPARNCTLSATALVLLVFAAGMSCMPSAPSDSGGNGNGAGARGGATVGATIGANSGGSTGSAVAPGSGGAGSTSPGSGGAEPSAGTGGGPGAGGSPSGFDAASVTTDADQPPAPPAMVTDPGNEGDGNVSKNGPYNPPPEATLEAGVTAGKLADVAIESKVFPGGNRTVQVYIPTGYVEGTAAPFIVLQDGPSYVKNFKLNTVLDNMIAKKALPLMLAIFIPNGGGRRSVEYDTLSDAYVRFVLEDVLPTVEKTLPVKLTTDPEGRAAGGHSSGGIAAFTMAWERPEQFRRVLSHSGSFVSLRGGDKYPGLVKAAGKKPLRVFLSVGSMDNENGRWKNGNDAMAAALAAQGYHHRYVLLNGGSHAQGSPAAILPESLLWLWRGYPIAGK
jgi:enterochelin esterase-like enzyme